MMHAVKKIHSGLLLVAVLAMPAWAQKPEKQHDLSDGSHGADVQLAVQLLAPLAGADRELIRDYMRSTGVRDHQEMDTSGKHKKLPPGLQKKLDRGGELPPGWQKKVARGEVISPDYMRHANRLPPDLHQRLQGYNEGAELLLLEDRVVRIATGQGTVLDVIEIADIVLR